MTKLKELKDYPLFIHNKEYSDGKLSSEERLDLLINSDEELSGITYWDAVGTFTELEGNSLNREIYNKMNIVAEKVEKYAEELIELAEVRLNGKTFNSVHEKYTTGDGLFIHEMYSIVHTLNLIKVIYLEDLEEQESK